MPLNALLSTGLYAQAESEQAEGWLDSWNGYTPETEEYGIGNISQAGVQRDTRAMGMFWFAVGRDEWPTDPAERAKIEANLQEPHGDRRTEIEMIGRELDQVALTAQLDACELNFQLGEAAGFKIAGSPSSVAKTHELALVAV